MEMIYHVYLAKADFENIKHQDSSLFYGTSDRFLVYLTGILKIVSLDGEHYE